MKGHLNDASKVVSEVVCGVKVGLPTTSNMTAEV